MFSHQHINQFSRRVGAPLAALVAFGVVSVTGALPSAHAGTILPGVTLVLPVGQAGGEDAADAALSAKDYPKAISLYSALIQATPKKNKLYLNRGLAYFSSGQFDKSAQDFGTFITLRPNLIEGYLNRAYAYNELGKAEEGLADLAKVESLDASKVDQKLRGDLLMKKKDYAGAIAAYTKVAAAGGAQGAVGSLLIGDALSQQGDEAGAIAAYGKAITAAPTNPYGFGQRGLLYLKGKKYDLASKDLGQYVTLAPNDPFGYINHAKANILLDTPAGYTAAKADLTKYLALTSANPAQQVYGLKLLGTVQSQGGDSAGAITTYTKVLAADSKDASALFERGKAYMDTKAYPDAIKDFGQYLAVAPTGPDAGDAAYNLGSAYLATKPADYEKAVPAFSTAIKANGKDAAAYYGRMLSYFNLQQYDKAIADSEAVIANGDPKSDIVADAYAKQGTSYDKLAKAKGDKALGVKAIAAIKKYTTLKPKDEKGQQYYTDLVSAYSDPATIIAEITAQLTPPPADPKAAALLYYNRGIAYVQSGDKAKGIADLGKVTTLTPTDDEAWATLAATQSSNGDTDGAIASYTKVIALKPDKPELLAARGDLYVTKKEYAKADADYAAFLTKAGDKAPTSAILTQAQLKQALGKPDEAITYYTKYLAVEKDPALTGEATRRLGAAQLAKGDTAGAIKTYSDYLGKNPKDAVALSNRAQAYLQSGDFEKAMADLNTALAAQPNSAPILTQHAFANSKEGDDWVKKGDPDKAKASYDAAIADCDKAIAADAKYALAYYRKGFAAYKNASDDAAGDAKYYTVALDAFNKFVAADPSNPEVANVKKAIAEIKTQAGG